MELEQIDSVSLQAAERLVDLGRGGCLCAPIDLGHEKRLLPIAVAQRVAHADFTLAAVVAPAVVEKIDSFIETRSHDANTLLGIRLVPKMVATEPDEQTRSPLRPKVR